MRGFAVLSALLLTACAGMQMDPPDGFLILHEGGAGLRATSPDGARLLVREFDDPNRGSLDYWIEALAHDLERERGYVLGDRAEIDDAGGRKGVLSKYRVHAAGEPHGYLIAVFVLDGRIRVAEFVAPRAVFDARVDAVATALTTLR